MDELPCKECMLIAMCRHKFYSKLFEDCSIIKGYIPNANCVPQRDRDKILLLQSILKPSMWKYAYNSLHDSLHYLVYGNDGIDEIPPVFDNLYIYGDTEK